MKLISVSLMLLAIVVISCKKDAPEKFDPVGVWEGNIASYTGTIINKSDGTFRLFVGLNYGDTASAATALGGKYTYNNGVYRAAYANGGPLDSGVLVTSLIQPRRMKGYLRIASTTTFFDLDKK